MNPEIFARVLQVAADSFNQPLSELTRDSTPDTVEGWDSLTHLNFLLALEQSFGCEIEPAEGERAAKSLGDAVLVLTEKVSATAPDG